MPGPHRPPLGRILTWLLLAVAVLPLSLAVAAPVPAPVAPATAAQAVGTEPMAFEGGTVYQASCAMCHGANGEGGAGPGGETGAPALRGLPAAYVDLTVRTGRMPLPIEPFTVPDARLSSEQREALMVWAQDELELTGSVPEVVTGSASAGRVGYLRHCSACHGPAGGGGIAGGGTEVPPITSVDAVAVVEALRVGPFEMPQFSEQVISEDEAEDIAAYVVEELADPAGETPVGLAEISSVTAGALTAVLLAVLVAVAVLVARLTRPRSHER